MGRLRHRANPIPVAERPGPGPFFPDRRLTLPPPWGVPSARRKALGEAPEAEEEAPAGPEPRHEGARGGQVGHQLRRRLA